jgi:hypothetical protein
VSLVEFGPQFILLKFFCSVDGGLHTFLKSLDSVLEASDLFSVLITLNLDIFSLLLQVFHLLRVDMFGFVDELVESLLPVVSLLFLLIQITCREFELTFQLFHACP